MARDTHIKDSAPAPPAVNDDYHGPSYLKVGRGPVLKDTFFLLWNLTYAQPIRKHKYISTALAEAKRLSTKHPGEIFYVVNACGLAYTPPRDTA